MNRPEERGPTQPAASRATPTPERVRGSGKHRPHGSDWTPAPRETKEPNGAQITCAGKVPAAPPLNQRSGAAPDVDQTGKERGRGGKRAILPPSTDLLQILLMIN